MSAASMPTIARPNHRTTTKGWLSMYKATTSPSAHPCARAQCATVWHRSCSSLKLQTWNKRSLTTTWQYDQRQGVMLAFIYNPRSILTSPVASYINAGLSGCFVTSWANNVGMVCLFRRLRYMENLTRKITSRHLLDREEWGREEWKKVKKNSKQHGRWFK